MPVLAVPGGPTVVILEDEGLPLCTHCMQPLRLGAVGKPGGDGLSGAATFDACDEETQTNRFKEVVQGIVGKVAGALAKVPSPGAARAGKVALAVPEAFVCIDQLGANVHVNRVHAATKFVLPLEVRASMTIIALWAIVSIVADAPAPALRGWQGGARRGFVAH